MNNIAKLGQEFGHYVIQLRSELLVKTGQSKSLSDMERNIRQMLVRFGNLIIVPKRLKRGPLVKFNR